MARRQDIQSADGILERYPGIGVIRQFSTSAPTNGAIGYAQSCLWHKVGGTGTGATNLLFINNGSNGFGSNSTANWVLIF